MSSSLACIKCSHPREFCFQKLIINAESLTLLISAGKLCLHLRPFTKAYTKGGGGGGGRWPPQAADIHRRNCRTVSQVMNYKRTQTQLVSFPTDSRSRGSNRQFSTMDTASIVLIISLYYGLRNFPGHPPHPPVYLPHPKIIHVRLTEESYIRSVRPRHLASR